jgi:malonyl-CoA O-methyltransferase
VPLTIPSTDTKSSAPIDVLRVRTLFSRPERVTDSDFLRREIAGRMHERLALIKIAPKYVLDTGCGEGADLPALQNSFPDAHIVGIDGATTMLHIARDRHIAGFSSVNRLLKKWLPITKNKDPGLLCSDFAQLPFGTNAVNLIWSNLALHWHPQPDRVFAEWRRVLCTDGLLMFSCFGPDTFRQLRNAFAEVDEMPHALPFVDMHDFGDMLVNVGFSTPVMDMETITVTYESVDKLVSDVRAWGGNPLLSRRRGLLSANAWSRVVDALNRMRQPDGKIPLTFEIVYGHAFRPAPRATEKGESIIRLDFHKK